MEGIANETDIRKERGLSDSEPDSERGAGEGTDQVRTDEEELSEGAQERDLSGNDSDRGAESTLSADTGAGRAENGTSDRTDGEVGGSERGTESSRSDALGSEDEQHQTLSGGNRADRTDLHLSSEEQSNNTMREPDSDSNSLSGSFSDKTEDFTELQKGILCFDNYLIHKRPEIAGYFQSEQDAVLQTEYLKNSFRMEEFTELYIGDVRAGYRADEDGLTMWKGNYLSREAESRLSWEDARYWVNSYIEDGVYLLPGEVAEQIDTDGMFKQLDLFTMFSEQVGNIAMKQAEEKSVMPTGFVLPEKQIDDILRSGGGRDDSRKRIYAKYQQRKTAEEMTAFLKKEYGTTGKGFEFDGKQIAVWFDEGGMRVGYGTSATEHPILTMEWKEIEQNIRRQVENGTYMGANEAYLVDEVERSRIANHLFFFFRDGMGEMPEELELKAGNYLDAHARLVELLSTPEEVAECSRNTGNSSDNTTLLVVSIVLVIVLSPVWIGMLGGVFGLVMGIIGTLFGIAVGFLAGGVACIGIGISYLVVADVPMGLLAFGLGALLAAVGILALLGLVQFCGRFIPWVIRGLVKICRGIFNRKGKEERV